MTPTSDDIRAHVEPLNRSFYQENDPGDFLLVRLYALCVAGGSYDRFKEILFDGIDFANNQILLTPAEDDDPDGGCAKLKNPRLVAMCRTGVGTFFLESRHVFRQER